MTVQTRYQTKSATVARLTVRDTVKAWTGPLTPVFVGAAVVPLTLEEEARVLALRAEHQTLTGLIARPPLTMEADGMWLTRHQLTIVESALVSLTGRPS